MTAPSSSLEIAWSGGTRTLGWNEQATVGRSPDVEVPVADESRRTSRRHGRIRSVEGRGWVYEDLRSRSGSFLDGSPVSTVVIATPVTISLGGVDGERLVLTPERAQADQPNRFLRTVWPDRLGAAPSRSAVVSELYDLAKVVVATAFVALVIWFLVGGRQSSLATRLRDRDVAGFAGDLLAGLGRSLLGIAGLTAVGLVLLVLVWRSIAMKRNRVHDEL